MNVLSIETVPSFAVKVIVALPLTFVLEVTIILEPLMEAIATALLLDTTLRFTSSLTSTSVTFMSTEVIA